MAIARRLFGADVNRRAITPDAGRCAANGAGSDRLRVDASNDAGSAGTSSGARFAPGSDNAGWVVPPPVRLEGGGELRLLKDAEAVHAAYRAIASSTRCVCLETYIFRNDATGRVFSTLLAARARAGVDVRVICDAFGSAKAAPELFQEMRSAGVLLRAFHPLTPWESRRGFRPHQRDHRKLLVVDDDVGGLGGQDVGDEFGRWLLSAPDRPPWRDTAVAFRGPDVLVLKDAFERMWRYAGGERCPIEIAELFHGACVAGVCSDGGDVSATQLPTGNDQSLCSPAPGSVALLAAVPRRGSPLPLILKRLLREARHSVELTMAYFAPPDDLTEELCRLARGGVRVRLMLPGRSDVPLLVTAARSYYERLLSAGAEVYEREEAVLHAKTLCIDGRLSMVGSTNFDWRSFRLNCELSAVIDSHALGEQLRLLFEHDVRFARKMEPGQWRRRPALDKLSQWAVKLIRPLL